MVADISPGTPSAFTRRYVYAAEWRPDVTFTTLNGVLYFSAVPTAFGWSLLYRSDGTTAGTVAVTDASSSTIVMDPRLFLDAPADRKYLVLRGGRSNRSSAEPRMGAVEDGWHRVRHGDGQGH